MTASEPGSRIPGGLQALYDGRGRAETPIWIAVHDEQITHMHGYATEVEARAALDAGSPAANADSPRPAEESTTSPEMT